MFLAIFYIILLLVVLCGLFFTKTSKDMPKSWYEWRSEFRYQFLGIVGLLHDFLNRSRDRVDLYKQPESVAVITGGNRGIGLRVVEKLLACDMTVIMGVRDPQSAKSSVAEIVDLSKSGGRLICEELDISNLTSVKAFAKRIKEKYEKVDILLNNAGIMFAPFRLTADDFESHLATNYLGHFLLTHLLLPQLKAAGEKGRNARVVNVSSCANLVGKINYDDINGKKHYYPGTAYAQSKLAQILSTRHMQRLLEQQNAPVQVNAVHPGIVDTDLFKHTTTTYVPFLKKIFFKAPEQGSRCIVFAAIDPSVEGCGGVYYSNCGRGPVHGSSRSPEQCEKLFNFTCKLLNIKDFGLLLTNE